MTFTKISIPMGFGPRRHAMIRRRFWHGARLGLLIAGIAACSSERLVIPNYNQPTTEGLSNDPTAVQLLATGVLDGVRDGIAGMARDFGIFGRETYNYFPTDGRNISNYLVGIPGPQRLDPAGFASGNWTNRFQNQRNAVQLIDAANLNPALSAQQKSAVAGFAKTFRALELLYAIVSRDTLGTPVDIPADPASPAPFVTRDSVYKFISATLDEAATDLQAGGTAFPIVLHSGFTGFDTPATFLQFNRALAARVLAYRASLPGGCGATCYNQALTAVAASFASPVGGATSLADLDRGTYSVYSTAAGDTPNANSFAQQNYIFAHASIQSDAQSGPSGIDARYTRKVVTLASPVAPPSNLNITATHRFTIYPTPNSPAPFIRNEELMLIRAEANIFTGNFAAAMQDINNIRSVSGGLNPVVFATQAAGLTALLYERRYSLLFEGQRWNDHRRFGLLGLLPIDQAGQFVAKVMPIPQAECDARVTKPNGC
ncbi:MAG: RagB/SusD family nutrient uptake outer membrane protein [Anaerolineae bacterium]|nr:RagB/SusD family nutrient uptake outer membrane protein [Gemmatimonadaceae bacterium]